MSYSERVFERVLKEIQFKVPHDVGVLKAYIKLLLAVKCQDERMEHLCRVLWTIQHDLKYTYLDNLYMLQQDMYEYAREGRDDEIPILETNIRRLKDEFSEIQLMLHQFQELGISYF